MQKRTITRRRMPVSRRSSSRPGPGDLFVPGLRVTWRAFWQDVAHPRLVRVAVLLFPLLALLVLLAHLAGVAQEPGQRMPSSTTPHPVLSVAAQMQAFYQGDPSIGWDRASNIRPGGPASALPLR